MSVTRRSPAGVAPRACHLCARVRARVLVPPNIYIHIYIYIYIIYTYISYRYSIMVRR